jgi:acyl-CoA synthetase (AMP-forming)/AMP-acid ligase II/thioesterase domain-containing protein/acyl carrier protein
MTPSLTALTPLTLDTSGTHVADYTVARRVLDALDTLGALPALCTPAETITYGELGRAVAGWREHLRAGDIGEGPLAFVIDVTAGSLAALLGAITERIPVVLIDPNLTADRARVICSTAEVTAVVCDRTHAGTAGALTETPVIIETPVITDAPPERAAITPPQASTPPGLVSYQFTSGSTGTPKAVLHTDRMWLGDALMLQERFGFGPGHRVGSVLPAGFGAGLNVLLASLMTGSTLLHADARTTAPEVLLNWIEVHSVQVLVATPSLLRALVVADAGARVDSLIRVVTTGEPVHGKDFQKARAIAPQAVFTNWVGSSETGGLAHRDYHPGEAIPQTLLPAGRPAPGKAIGVGPDGTITVRSAYLSGGYLDQEATAAVFTTHGDGTRSFTTGDRGRWDSVDGLVLLGRRDQAVKIRGYLVDPSEIVTALTAAPDIIEAYVLVSGRDTSSPVLTAFAVPDGAQRSPVAAELRQRLSAALPSWMLPTHIVVLAELPRTERGKVDPSALSVPTRVIGVPPLGGIESEVAGIWRQALHLDEIGRTENYHELGGDSLTLHSILSEITRRYGLSLTTADLAAAPTVAEFSTRIGDARRSRGRTGPAGRRTASTTVALRAPSDTAKTPLWCYAGAGASAVSFLPLATLLPDDQPVFAFQPFGLEERGIPDWTVARRHLRDLQAISPRGPHVLVGHSLGGLIAIDTARRLDALGQRVRLVVILDTFLPPSVTGGHGVTMAAPTEVNAGEEALSTAELWRRRLALPLAGIIRRPPEEQIGALEEVGRRVGMLHRPKLWSGDALVYRSRFNDDTDEQWRSVLTGRVEFRSLDCDHPSVVRAPSINMIAGEVAALVRDPGGERR